MPLTKLLQPAKLSPLGQPNVSVLTKVLTLNELSSTSRTGIT